MDTLTRLRTRNADKKLPFNPRRAYILRDSPTKPTLGAANLNALPGPEDQAGIDEKNMSCSVIVSTTTRDRYGDVIESRGAQLVQYAVNPVVLFNHNSTTILPIGKASDQNDQLTVQLEDERILARTFFDPKNPLAVQVFDAMSRKFFRGVSVGFNPIWEEDAVVELFDSGSNPPEFLGFWFKRWEMVEYSHVVIPANFECVNQMLTRGLDGRPAHPEIVRALEPFKIPQTPWSNGWTPPQTTEVQKALETAAEQGRKRDGQYSTEPPAGHPVVKAHMPGPHPDFVRWNKSHSRAFDVDQPAEPAAVLYDWISQYLQCQVRDLCEVHDGVPSVRMGTFLTGLKKVLEQYDVKAVRNFNSDGTEGPPFYEHLKLNSKLSDDFLIEGTGFYEGRGQHAGKRIVIRYTPSWYGLNLTLYSTYDSRALTKEVVDKAWEWAGQNNFLRGEAFALSGEFIDRTPEGWDDVILEEANKTAIQRVTDLFNTKGAEFANRGIILTGPPGTGKTLSGRIIRNTAKGTFIWISSRDFHRSGSFGSFSFAFDLARELAPSILFFEDVDNWLEGSTIDLLKTEMDGIARSAGVLTILTTNYPERLPNALLDRPGRFHDVLKFDVPTPDARRQMLQKWLPGFTTETVEKAVVELEGYSGAHVYELAQFVKVLKDHDGLEADAAMTQALAKIKEQRELIQEFQLNGSGYDHWTKALVARSLGGRRVEIRKVRDMAPNPTPAAPVAVTRDDMPPQVPAQTTAETPPKPDEPQVQEEDEVKPGAQAMMDVHKWMGQRSCHSAEGVDLINKWMGKQENPAVTEYLGKMLDEEQAFMDEHETKREGHQAMFKSLYPDMEMAEEEEPQPTPGEPKPGEPKAGKAIRIRRVPESLLTKSMAAVQLFNELAARPSIGTLDRQVCQLFAKSFQEVVEQAKAQGDLELQLTADERAKLIPLLQKNLQRLKSLEAKVNYATGRVA